MILCYTPHVGCCQRIFQYNTRHCVLCVFVCLCVIATMPTYCWLAVARHMTNIIVHSFKLSKTNRIEMSSQKRRKTTMKNMPIKQKKNLKPIHSKRSHLKQKQNLCQLCDFIHQINDFFFLHETLIPVVDYTH